MSRSFETINYSLRPAKAVERKMLCEAFRRLSSFQPIDTYGYIGLGSTYFSDFILFHKELNITAMRSIEREESVKDRFEFNRPFGCVTIVYDESAKVLPTENWESPKIVWLDYDDPLDKHMLADVKTVMTEASPRSVLVVSANAEPGSASSDRFGRLVENVGDTKVPPKVTDSTHLSGWKTAGVYRQIIENEIEETLSKRNKGRTPMERLVYTPLFNFHYSDGARMVTVGGIITLATPTEHELLQKCEFRRESLPFICREPDDEYKIEVPSLTSREIRHLDRELPRSSALPVLSGVPEEDIRRYAQIYRYFPTFAETNF